MDGTERGVPPAGAFVVGGLLTAAATGAVVLRDLDAAPLLSGAAVEVLAGLMFALPLAAAWTLARRLLARSARRLPAWLAAQGDFLAGAAAFALLPLFSTAPLVLESLLAFLLVALPALALGRLGRRLPTAAGAAVAALLVLRLFLGGASPAGPTAPLGGPRADAPLPAADAPNVLVVSLDTLRADALGATRGGAPLMPTLDALAARGVAVEAYAASNQTGPSHASLLTGRGFLEHPVNLNGIPLPASVPTAAEAFAALGWDTRGVIANPLLAADLGLARGFHAWDDRLVRTAPLETAFMTLKQRSPRVSLFAKLLPRVVPQSRLRALFGGDRKEQRRGTRVVALARDLLDDADSRRPWLLLAHFLDPHAPYQAPAPFRYRLAAVDGGGIDGAPMPKAFLDTVLAPLDDAARAPLVAEYRARYEEEVMYVDHCLGELLAEAERRSAGRPLWIVVTSDHGEHFLEHGQVGHSTSPYEELMRAVMVVDGDGLDTRADLPRSGEEVFPFLLEALGASTGPPRREPMLVQGYLRTLCVVEDGWKLILEAANPYGIYVPRALYHLAVDPQEQDDLLAGEAERVDGMLDRLEERRSRDRRFEAATMRDDPATQAMLKEMGYVD